MGNSLLNFLRGCLLAAGLIITAAQLSADDIIELAPFQVIGSRLGDYETGSAQELGSGELGSLQAVSLWESMQQLAGVHIDQPAGLGGNTMLYLRGSEPNLAKVLVDGIEVNNANDIRGGTYNFNALDTNSLNSLSLMAGTQSAIHGSDALSGVISLSTMPDSWDEMRTSGQLQIAGAEGSSYDASLRQSYKLDGLYFQAGISVTEEDDWFPGSEFEATRINLGLVSRMGDRGLLRFSGFASENERTHYPDDSGGPEFAVMDGLDYHDSEEYGVSLQVVQELGVSAVLRAKVFHYYFEEFVDSPGVVPGERDPFGVPPNLVDSELERTGLSAYIEQQAGDLLSIVYGLSCLEESGVSYNEVSYPFGTFPGSYDLDTETTSAFVEGSFAVSESGSLNAAVRLDDISDLKDVWTKRLAYLQEVPGLKSRLRLSWGDGFKKPSFFALGNPTIGNPNLLPEESDLYEISLETSLPEERIQLVNTIFRQEYNNLIDFFEGPPPRLANLDKVITKGFTSQLKTQLESGGEVTIRATYVEVDVVGSDELLRNRPKWRLGATLKQPIGEDLQLRIIARFVDSRLDSSIPTSTIELDSYFRLDTSLAWQVSDSTLATFAIDNLLDDNYQDAIGFANPGLRLRGGVQILW